MSRFTYYSDVLSAERLKLCYDLAPPSIQRFLEVESDFVRQRIEPGARVLELGCGYGRVLEVLTNAGADLLVGIDLSLSSLLMGRRNLAGTRGVGLAQMDAGRLAFAPRGFDLVCCIQNGISAFHIDQYRLLADAVALTRPGGRVLFSSYSKEIWEDRLLWFRLQADHGLVGEIDDDATGNGVIVCKDGFTATTVSPRRFEELASGLGDRVEVAEVAGCSVFCEVLV